MAEQPAEDEGCAERIETALFETLKLVNDWLKFAEAKNAGIVGLSSGALAVLLAFVTSAERPPFSLIAGAAVTAGLISLSAGLLVSLTSFNAWVPPDPSEAGPSRPDGAYDSIFYFGHLAAYNIEALSETFADRYQCDRSAVSANHRDLAGQVIINSRITARKLRLFRQAMMLFGAGVLASGAGILLATLAD